MYICILKLLQLGNLYYIKVFCTCVFRSLY